MTDATHLVSLSIGVDNPTNWYAVWEALNTLSVALSTRAVSMNVSSQLLDEEEEMAVKPVGETHTEDTLFKVAVALREAGVDEGLITPTITTMQNAGILFRERS